MSVGIATSRGPGGYDGAAVDTEKDWFGPHLQELRQRAGLTQLDLAELAQVGVQTVKDWEKGRKRPHLDRLPQLAQILQVDLGGLFPGSPLASADRVREGVLEAGGLDERLARMERRVSLVLAEIRQIRGARGPAQPDPG